jgi:putative FmdB family regulatory protein
MLIYAYTCPSCGEHLEVLQYLNEGTPDCPDSPPVHPAPSGVFTKAEMR